MLGIALTLVAMIVVVVLAFCTSDDRSPDCEAAVAAWAPQPRRK